MASKALSYEQLVALAEQPQEQTELALLSTSDRELVERLRGTFALLADDQSVAPPDHVRNRALRLMRRPAAAPGPGLLARLRAVLAFDSLAAAPPAGVRGEAARLRQLLFRAGSFDVDMQVLPQGGRLRLLGQVLARSGATPTGEALLSQGARPLASVELDELGEFSFDELLPGTYSLLIRTPDAEIDVPEITFAA
jgi:hypothetical protein